MSWQHGDSERDRVFGTSVGPIPSFAFNEDVAAVFDDMADRSIPFYREVQRLTVVLAQRYAQKDTNIYDLGCSTGTTMSLLKEAISAEGPSNVSIFGVDSSKAMCEKARGKLGSGKSRNPKPPPNGDGGTGRGMVAATEPGEFPAPREAPSYSPVVHVKQRAIEREPLKNASVVIMNYTLQFIPPQKRNSVISRIFHSLVPGGVLLISDKMLQASTSVSHVFVDVYYDLKRAQGYSDLEIAQKREALENVLIPYPSDEERDLLKQSGFSTVDTYFSWCNFSSFICVKNELP